MSKTLFSRIIDGDIPADIVHQDDHVVGFRDVNPQAPLHVLFVPRRPLATLNEFSDDDQELAGRLMLAAIAYAKSAGVAEQGYRLVINCNNDGGQSVYHVHLHLLAGRALGWPPG